MSSERENLFSFEIGLWRWGLGFNIWRTKSLSSYTWRDFSRAVTYKYLPLVLIVFPIFFLFYFVYRYGVNVLYWDEWPNVNVYRQMIAHKIDWWALFRSGDMEDLMFFPKLLTFVIEKWTYFNMKDVMYLNVLFQMGAFMSLSFLAASEFSEMNSGFWFFVPLSWLLFSLRPHAGLEGVIFGFRLAWYMINFFWCLGLYLLSLSLKYRQNRWASIFYFLLAAIAGFMASFSSFHGLLIWPAGLIYLWLRSDEYCPDLRKKWGDWRIFSWIFLSVAVTALYLSVLGVHTIGSGSGGQSPRGLIMAIVSHPFYSVEYYLLNMGAVFMNQTSTMAISLGAVFFALFVFFAVRIKTSPYRWRYALPVALMVLGILFGGLLLGRLNNGFGGNGNYYSYWEIHSVLLIVGLYLGSVLLVTSKKMRVIVGFLWSIFLIALMTNNIKCGIKEGQIDRFQRYLGANTVLNYQRGPTRLMIEQVGGPATVASFNEKVAFLDKNGFSVFHAGEGKIPEDIKYEFHPPKSYAAVESKYSAEKDALECLWSIYLTSPDLEQAFRRKSSSFTHDLIMWAYGDARTTGYYRHNCDAYAGSYIALASAEYGAPK